jgi:hypothetical protein
MICKQALGLHLPLKMGPTLALLVGVLPSIKDAYMF